MTFQDFNFDSSIQEGIDAMGYKQPSPIQAQAIPIILGGKDLIACAQTGTGKTAAFVLPVMHKILQAKHRHLNTLIIAPTRELAQQIDQQIEGLSYFAGISSIPVYGGGDGAAWEQQKRAMEQGADIIIATPGRLLSQLQSKKVVLDHLEHLILDEADRMLDMGFYDDIVRIISFLPTKRQTILFSATMPPKMRALAKKIMHHPEEINLALSKPAEGVNQIAYSTFDNQKLPLLTQLLKDESYTSVIIFASTKDHVKQLDREFQKLKLAAKAFHSDLDQDTREGIMRDFKNRKLNILIGTDVLSRGIDVEGISLVVNYDVPPDAEDYIHRIGRTARAETKGTAITFINEKDQFRFGRIEQLIERVLDKTPLPESLGAAPIYEPLKKRPKEFGKKKPNFKGRNHSPKPNNG